MKPYTLEAHYILCRIPTGSSSFFSDRFPKYWDWFHFYHKPHSYFAQLDSLTLEDVMMKRDLETLYSGFGYEEKFDPTKVKSSLQRKWSIKTHFW